MLIGLAIDFGVHLITRYEEELRHGKTEEEALTKAMVFTGQGIFTGALTTAGAFRGDGLHAFQGHPGDGRHLRRRPDDLPIPMMTILPVLLLRGKQNVMDHTIQEDDRRAHIESFWLERPVLVALVIV